MKSLIHWGVTFGLAVSITLSYGLSFTSPSLALPEPEVVQKLEQVPVFIIVNQDNSLVLLSPKNEEKSANLSPKVFIFADYTDASNMLDNLQKNNSDLKEKIKVIPISFKVVYEMIKERDKEPEKTPPIALYSRQEDIMSAQKILEQRGESLENLQRYGLPLFFITVGQDNEFVIQRDEEGNNFIPFYMELTEAQADLEIYKQQLRDRSPEEFKIQVVPLLEFIQVLLEKDDEAIQIMEILPSQKQVNEANRLLENSNTQTSK